MNKEVCNFVCRIEPWDPSRIRPVPSMDINIDVTCTGETADKIFEAMNDSMAFEWHSKEYQEFVENVLMALIGNTSHPKVEKVIFNDPATILFWDDGGKTVVKCRECGDGKCIHDKDAGLWKPLDYMRRCNFCRTHFDREKAVMAGMLKRLYPNYQNVLRKAMEDGDD